MFGAAGGSVSTIQLWLATGPVLPRSCPGGPGTGGCRRRAGREFAVAQPVNGTWSSEHSKAPPGSPVKVNAAAAGWSEPAVAHPARASRGGCVNRPAARAAAPVFPAASICRIRRLCSPSARPRLGTRGLGRRRSPIIEGAFEVTARPPGEGNRGIAARGPGRWSGTGLQRHRGQSGSTVQSSSWRRALIAELVLLRPRACVLACASPARLRGLGAVGDPEPARPAELAAASPARFAGELDRKRRSSWSGGGPCAENRGRRASVLSTVHVQTAEVSGTP